ncbi:MAG: polysaccharide deacetylase family protein, partial [Desulfobacterales bacterium]|nr:polysaccharide deacetylase family protein [Desulfobacterales bacterium]
RYLKDNNYRVIPLSKLVDMIRERGAVDQRQVVITIDDGYKSLYANAYPVLREFGYPFTVFLPTEPVDKGYRSSLTWDQVRRLKSEGVDFQDHSYSHGRMGDIPAGADRKSYRERIRDDLGKSIMAFKSNLGQTPRYFAIPYGEYNEILIDEAMRLGYEAVFSQDPGPVSADTPVFRIPREPILGREWSTLDHFRKVLQRVDLPIKSHDPSIEPYRGGPIGHFGARLLYPGRYRPETLGIYISELGWRKGKLSGDYLKVDGAESLQQRINRVAVSGIEKTTGRTAIRFWMIIKQP